MVSFLSVSFQRKRMPLLKNKTCNKKGLKKCISSKKELARGSTRKGYDKEG